MKMGTAIFLCMLLARVSAAALFRVRKDHTIDYFNGNCSDARHQQLEEWIPEGCPSVKEAFFFAAPPDGRCNARCSQYLYESLNECYGEEQAFGFEQECFMLNATGTQCYMVAQPLPMDAATYCNGLHFNDTYCSPTCYNYTKVMYETHGCCFFVAIWLWQDVPLGNERETIVKNILSTCNISADFCPPSFSESIIGVPPVIQNDTLNVGLITGLTILAAVLVTISIILVILFLLWLRIRKRKHSEW